MEALRFQIFLWLLNYWRMYRPEHFDMSDAWREICESMPPIPVCALEGCDTLLFGYNSGAFYCCNAHAKKGWFEENPAYMKAYMKDYQQTPERKAIRNAYQQTPEYKAWKKEYQKNYHQTPEVKTKDRARRQTPEYKATKAKTNKKYRQTPEYKAKNRARRQTPEYKAKKKEYEKNYYARKKAERLAAEKQTSP